MPSAIEQVLSALRTPLETAGLTIETDRQADDMLAGEEFPVVTLNWLGAEIQRIDSCGSYFWQAQVALDCWAKVATGQSVLAGCTAQVSTVAQVVQTEQETNSFGGLFHDCVPISVSDFAEMMGDRGCITVTLSVQYQTPKGDWNTILT